MGDVLTLLEAFALLWVAYFTAAILFVPKILQIVSNSKDDAIRDNTSVQAPSSSASGYLFLSLAALSTMPMLQSYHAALQKHIAQVEKKIGQLRGNGGASRGGRHPLQAAVAPSPSPPKALTDGKLRSNASDTDEGGALPIGRVASAVAGSRARPSSNELASPGSTALLDDRPAGLDGRTVSLLGKRAVSGVEQRSTSPSLLSDE